MSQIVNGWGKPGMSESVAESSTASSPFGEVTHHYALSSDLARLSLPAEYKDEYRRLAWVNSICFLFLVVGLVGLKPPKIIVRPLTEVSEPAPVVLPPEEQTKPPPQVVQEEEPQPQEKPIETPQVITVVAAADTPNIAFAVPVQGAVAVTKEARFAAPPPPITQAPRPPVKFDPNNTTGGSYPPPKYPGFAERNRFHGTVTVEILVDAAGSVTSAKLVKSSGYPILDEAALKVVKESWKFPPGAQRDYLWDCTFQLP